MKAENSTPKKRGRPLKLASKEALINPIRLTMTQAMFDELTEMLMSSKEYRYMSDMVREFIQDGINKFKNQEQK
jgi:hypothetical protein